MAFSREHAAETILCEASNGTHDERLGVMHVIQNRAKDGRWGHSVAEVCMYRYQFSEYLQDRADNSNLERVLRMTESDPAMVEALAIYDAVEGGAPDITFGALNFYADSIPAPDWTKGAVFCGKVGRTMFWRGVK